MPLVKCDTCKHEVSDTAELCPHCGQELPTKFFTANPDKYKDCNGCWVKNYVGASVCRSCGKSLQVETDMYYKCQFADELPKGFAAFGAGIPFLIGLVWYYLAIPQQDASSRGIIIVGTIIITVVGAGIGWTVGRFVREAYRRKHNL